MLSPNMFPRGMFIGENSPVRQYLYLQVRVLCDLPLVLDPEVAEIRLQINYSPQDATSQVRFVIKPLIMKSG